MIDIKSNVGAVTAISPAVQAASLTGAALSLAGFNSAVLIVNTGAVVGAGDFSVKLQESPDSVAGNFTDIAAKDIQNGAPSTLIADSVVRIGYTGAKPYVRAVLTKASGTSIALGAVLIKGHPTTSPTP